MIALSNTTLKQLPPQVLTPAYDRQKTTPGIAHLAVGNFHRAHQALYVDRVLARPGQQDWAIVGVGLRDNTRETRRAAIMAEQDGLYTLTEFAPDNTHTIRVLGAITEYVQAAKDRAAAIKRLADPAIKIVSLTITEGGYYVDASGKFMLDDPAIAADLKRDVPETAFGLVTEALRLRRESGIGPFTVMTCDNLRDNGTVARTAFCTFAEARDPALGAWIKENVTFPSTMVDRITPSVSETDIARLDDMSGIADQMPLFAEDFTQWVIEDKFCAGRPELEAVGVEFTDDVGPYEQVKLRMLNASHSMLALPGVLMDYDTVPHAMADAGLVTLLEQFLANDASPLITPPKGVSLSDYARQVLHRFRNPAVGDQLLRIASDSASKLPVFWTDTVKGVLKDGKDHRRVAFGVACFLEYLRGETESHKTYKIAEPGLPDAAKDLALKDDLAAGLTMPVFSGWDLDQYPAFVEDVTKLRSSIRTHGARQTLKELGL
ncbi:NADPH-dependent L-sorbose reductase [Acetobacter malorum DSM 14337]|uniref:NADPH-dependent L-sorbose reductase n=1 Tax=Acetobacter malorum DSM 14337 TaxID=1307910 RepID=A0ABQ0PU46_9PROT|nr:mannitol dehydrogenase family protein [Acetobacter malorum]KXV04481.1 NADH-ubiquinone oxidoreductase subunit 6 [Acetobacter malorum]GBQ81508.1 NADPH-dependent L-sorbose reductase [Acetobacter malorum DSM 14337]